jgi:hypothetical protein
MIPFDYVGRNWRDRNRPRQFALEVLLTVCSILLLPFTLLGVFLWGLWRLAGGRPLAQ